MNKIKVTIFNKEYSIVGEESKEHIEKVAKCVDDEIKEVYYSYSNNKTNISPVILAAINLADKYIKEKENKKERIFLDDELSSDDMKLERNSDSETYLREELERLKKENYNLNEIINKFQNDMYDLQMELLARKGNE